MPCDDQDGDLNAEIVLKQMDPLPFLKKTRLKKKKVIHPGWVCTCTFVCACVSLHLI